MRTFQPWTVTPWPIMEDALADCELGSGRRSVNESSGASAVGFDGRRASQRPRSVASPAMKISRFTRERTGARAYREPVAHFYPWTGAWTRTLAEAALGAEVAGATCIVVKLAQRDCISRVERRRRASRYGSLRRPGRQKSYPLVNTSHFFVEKLENERG